MRKLAAVVMGAILVAGCNLPILPRTGAANPPTLTPYTVADATLPPVPVPTDTPASSPTASATPSATQTLTTKAWRTMLASSFTPAGTPVIALDCQVVMRSPANGATFSPNEHFSAGWKVRNTGSAGWDASDVEFVYVGGAKMYLSTVVHLQEDVEPGNVAILTADMRAPRSQSQYTTAWSLRKGDQYFCRLTLTITVE